MFALAFALPTVCRADIYLRESPGEAPVFSSERREKSDVLFLTGEPPKAGAPRRPAATPIRALGRQARLEPRLRAAAHRHGLDPALLLAVARVESGFDAKAVSRAGAVGVMQVMRSTARIYGVVRLEDADENIEAGARHLRRLIERFQGNLALALAAYNAGENAVERRGRKLPPFPETLAYVPQVLAAMQAYREVDSVSTGTR